MVCKRFQLAEETLITRLEPSCQPYTSGIIPVGDAPRMVTGSIAFFSFLSEQPFVFKENHSTVETAMVMPGKYGHNLQVRLSTQGIPTASPGMEASKLLPPSYSQEGSSVATTIEQCQKSTGNSVTSLNVFPTMDYY